MIEILNSKRMTIVIVVLIVICTIVVIIEEWFANSQLVISSLLTASGDNNQHHLPASGHFNIDIPADKHHQSSQHISQKPLVEPLDQSDIGRQDHIHWKQFLSFFSLVSFFGGISGLAVKYRQQQLRTKSLARFRKQVDSEDSNHTLINMRDLLILNPLTPSHNHKARVLNKQVIKYFVPTESMLLDDLNSQNQSGFIRILASDKDNSSLIAKRLEDNKEQLSIEKINILDKAIECPRKAKEGSIYGSSVVVKLRPTPIVDSTLSITKENYQKSLKSQVLETSNLQDTQRIVIDFSSPNIAKPFHFGHLKSTLLGNFLANLNQFLGNHVTRLNYIGDWGTQYGLIDLGLEKFKGGRDNSSGTSSSLRELLNIYALANEESKNDVAFRNEAKRRFQLMDKEADSEMMTRWRGIRDLSLDELERSYSRLGISFDRFEFESDYAKESLELVKKLNSTSFVSQLEDGVTIARIEKNNKMREVPVIRSDGASLYITRDLAAVIDRMNRFNFDKMLYVVGADQEAHFHNLKELVKNMDYPWSDRIVHVKMGKVLGMSTRSGKVILLSDIIEEATNRYIESTRNTPTSKVSDDGDIKEVGKQLALTALFVFDIRNARTTNYVFDWDLVMSKSSRSGINLQTTYARLSSLIEKALKSGIEPAESVVGLDLDSICCVEGINLMSYMGELDTALHSSYWSMDPSPLVNYALDLCKAINRARQSERLWVLGELDKRKARTRLTLFKSSHFQLEMIIKLIGLKPLNKV